MAFVDGGGVAGKPSTKSKAYRAIAGDERVGPVTPSDVLREEFMRPLGLSGRGLALELGIPSKRVTAIVAGLGSISAEMAIRLGERIHASAEFWLNLQLMHDLAETRWPKKHGFYGKSR